MRWDVDGLRDQFQLRDPQVRQQQRALELIEGESVQTLELVVGGPGRIGSLPTAELVAKVERRLGQVRKRFVDRHPGVPAVLGAEQRPDLEEQEAVRLEQPAHL